jgi:serine protease Do
MNRKWLAAVAGTAVVIGVAVAALYAQRNIVTRRGRTAIVARTNDGAWLGVRIKDVTADDAKDLKLPGEYGAVVTEVEEDSPAAKAGLKKDDVIVGFAGERVWSAAQLARLIRETPPGRKVNMELSRDGAKQAVAVTFETHEAEPLPFTMEMPRMEMPRMEMPMVQPNFNLDMFFSAKPRLGVSVDELTPQLAEYFGVSEGKGVLVREVMADTPAQKAGLKAGDCIVKIGDTPVKSVEDLQQALAKATRETEQYTLTIVRDRHEQTVNVRIEKPQAIEGPVAENGEFESEELANMLRQARSKEFQELRRNLNEQSRKWEEELRRSLQSQGKEFEKLRHELLRLQRDPSGV